MISIPAKNRQLQVAVRWSLVAVGLLTYNLVHLFSYMNDAIREERHSSLSRVEVPDAAAMWGFSVFFALFVVPGLLSLRKGRWSAALGGLVGGVLVAIYTAVGLYHGIHDGTGYLAFVAIVAVTVPGALAIRGSWGFCVSTRDDVD
ncbi:hypothetical protein [Burkholderia gladioli]|uniref:hypothetical protein n=1 Tax=Burkholderia gladioli TaxID=28095 RepID=UPI000F80D8B2|nr:hypothetical protein [Burkholderia gladioli]MDN7754846.1 hypothetical protein [Burkholderia gladioli]